MIHGVYRSSMLHSGLLARKFLLRFWGNRVLYTGLLAA
jgi:hypothetical protein